MDRLGFKQLIRDGAPTYYFEVLVNGESLGELLRSCWRLQSPGDVEYLDTIDSYIPHGCVDLYPINKFWSEQFFIDSSRDHVCGLTAFDKIVLECDGVFQLAITICGCGEWACSCIPAKVTVSETMITWDEFRWSKERVFKVGPFSFDRDQYCQAIDQMHAEAKNGG